jgi:hypothetical protein
MCYEEMMELACSHDDHVTNFLHFRIELLRSREDLQKEIYRELLLHCFVVVHGFFLNDQSSADR